MIKIKNIFIAIFKSLLEYLLFRRIALNINPIPYIRLKANIGTPYIVNLKPANREINDINTYGSVNIIL